jgi:hypothetical protein
MKRHYPKLKNYRVKRGFFLLPKWEVFCAYNDKEAIRQADAFIGFDEMFRFKYRKVVLQKFRNGKWETI